MTAQKLAELERLIKGCFEAVLDIQPSPAQSVAPEHNGMPTDSSLARCCFSDS
jgi:hypothetical protein